MAQTVQKSLDPLEDFVWKKIEEEGWSQLQLSDYLKTEFGTTSTKGYSVRSIQRFCQERDIHRTARMPEVELQKTVKQAVSEV